MFYQRVPARRKRPSDPIPNVHFVSRFPLAECFLRSRELHAQVDFVVRLVRTPPGDERNRALVRALRQLDIRLPRPFGKA